MSGLTRREKQCARLVARGASDKSIARHMGIAHNTARTHVRNVLGKMGVSRRFELANKSDGRQAF